MKTKKERKRVEESRESEGKISEYKGQRREQRNEVEEKKRGIKKGSS